MSERRKVTIDGVEIDAPANWSDEEILQHHRDMRAAIESARAQTETLDLAPARRAIAEDMANSNTPWPSEMLDFVKATNALNEIAALRRAAGDPMTDEEQIEMLQRELEKRRRAAD